MLNLAQTTYPGPMGFMSSQYLRAFILELELAGKIAQLFVTH